MTVLLPLLAFLCASLIVAAAAMAFSPARATAIDRRLGEIRGDAPAAESTPYGQFVMDSVKRLARYAPKNLKEMGKLQRKRDKWALRRKAAWPG